MFRSRVSRGTIVVQGDKLRWKDMIWNYLSWIDPCGTIAVLWSNAILAYIQFAMGISDLQDPRTARNHRDRDDLDKRKNYF